MTCRTASLADCALLAEMNLQLIRDEGHRNPMTVAELERRMRDWLVAGEYTAVIFEQEARPLAYALYCTQADSSLYLRQFFVAREHRRKGIGRGAVELLFSDVWPPGSRVKIQVLCHNEPARRFWSALGFLDYAVSLERVSTGK